MRLGAFLAAAALMCLAGCRGGSGNDVISLETLTLPKTQSSPEQQPAEDGTGSQSGAGAESTNAGAPEGSAASEADSGAVTKETVCEEIYVYVCGCVNTPGVYHLEPGARIYEAIEAAGGMTDAADTGSINLALKLEDQMQIYVPSKEEVLSGAAYPGSAGSGTASGSQGLPLEGSADTGKVNLNTATAEQLDSLPGIGASKAEDILNYREEHGGFTSIEELMDIPGIKSGVFDKIKDFVTVD